METVSLAPVRTAAPWLEGLGARGVVGLALIAFSAAYYFGSLAPAAAELDRLEQWRAKLEAARPSTERAAPATPEQQLAEFYASLPNADGIEPVAERIYDIGKHLGVTLKQGSYRFVREDGARLGRYEINYLAQTEYFRARLMLRELMKEMPALALDAIGMQRQLAASPVAEMTLKVSLYVRQE